MEFIELAKERFSVRKYSDKKIESDKLEKILSAGMAAPTAKNNQPFRIYVIQSEEALATIDELTRCRFGAGTVLLFTYDTNEEWNNPLEDGVRSGVQDASIVATHVMLEAADLGIGTCWVCFFPNSQLEQKLEIPENEKAVLLMPMGYAAEDCEPSERHAKCRDSEEVIRYL